jgi:hypothetical protein
MQGSIKPSGRRRRTTMMMIAAPCPLMEASRRHGGASVRLLFVLARGPRGTPPARAIAKGKIEPMAPICAEDARNQGAREQFCTDAFGRAGHPSASSHRGEQRCLRAAGSGVRRPSGGDFSTASVAMLVPAPGRFSMTNCWPSRSIAAFAAGRAFAAVSPLSASAHAITQMGLVRHRAQDDQEADVETAGAPLSGHFATLLRATVRTLLADHDVYITDRHNVRDVPLLTIHFRLRHTYNLLVMRSADTAPARRGIGWPRPS